MPAETSRDLAATEGPIAAWLTDHLGRQGADVTDLAVDLRRHTGDGHSNEIIVVEASFRQDGPLQHRHLVVRLPPAGDALFPRYDLAMQVAVQDAVREHGVPVPTPIIHETDVRWLGTPFLVMPFVAGHDPGEVPVADPWLSSASSGDQRTLHEGFLDVVARVHTTPWRDHPVASALRGAGSSMEDEIRWWEDLVDWSFGGDVPAALAGAFDWCRRHRPRAEPPPGVLWGDVRVGNVIFDDAFAPSAVLDWEMASIGPAELDLSWYTALEAMTEHFAGLRVPGFLDREEILRRHEDRLDRPMVDIEWFEVFAMCRSAALNVRSDRLAARRSGREPRAAEDDAVLGYALAAIEGLT